MSPMLSTPIRPLLACLAAVMLLGGCGKSAPTHFYSLAAEARPEAEAPKAPCFSLGVGPVEFPAYLDRAQVVTRQSATQVHVAEFEQWVEPLQENFKRVLLENLSGMVCAKPFVLHPWPAGVRPDFQVTLQVLRFDGAPGQSAALRASWSVLDARGDLLTWKSSSLDEAINGQDFAALAAAQSRLVARLAGEIGQTLAALKK